MIDNLSIAFHFFVRRMLTSLSADEMSRLKYLNWSTNSRSLPPRVEMVLFRLKHITKNDIDVQ